MPKHTLVLEDLFLNESGRRLQNQRYAFALIDLVLLHFWLFFLNFCYATSLLAFIVKIPLYIYLYFRFEEVFIIIFFSLQIHLKCVLLCGTFCKSFEIIELKSAYFNHKVVIAHSPGICIRFIFYEMTLQNY